MRVDYKHQYRGTQSNSAASNRQCAQSRSKRRTGRCYMLHPSPEGVASWIMLIPGDHFRQLCRVTPRLRERGGGEGHASLKDIPGLYTGPLKEGIEPSCQFRQVMARHLRV